MLDKVMMERKEVRKDYDERLAHLEIRMGELQRQCRSMGIPIVFCVRKRNNDWTDDSSS